MSEGETTPEGGGLPHKIECHKSLLHRNIPADGTWVFLNGHGKYSLNFYTDSPPLPKMLILETTKDGKKFTSKPAKITPPSDANTMRQYEASIILSYDSLKFLHSILGEFIKMKEAEQPLQ